MMQNKGKHEGRLTIREAFTVACRFKMGRGVQKSLLWTLCDPQPHKPASSII